MKGNTSMDLKLNLSVEHASVLEERRCIPSELASEMGVVSRGTNLAFEFRKNGVCLYRQVKRETVNEDGSRGKTFHIEPTGADLFLWNDDCLNDTSSSATLVITEGVEDALSWLAAGASHVVSVPNGAPNRPGEGKIYIEEDRRFAYLWVDRKLDPRITRFQKIVLSVDADEAGCYLRDELIARLGPERCWFIQYPADCKDANDVLCKHGVDGLTDILVSAKPVIPNKLAPFSAIPVSNPACYSSGWGAFDRHFMLAPPQIIVVGGKGNHGKSQWTLALVANLARVHGFKTAILQFEDNPDRNREDLVRYARAWTTDGRFAVGDPYAWIDRMFVTIAPSEELGAEDDYNLAWLERSVEEAATRHGCKVVLIDPWNEVEHLWGKQDTEASYLNRALRHLKKLARRYRIAIIIVTHFTKEGGKIFSIKEASLYDLSGGAVWRNKADLGVIVWADDTASDERLIKVDKSKDFRRMGVPGVMRKRFIPDRATFECLGAA